jgi:hypothetical protein
MSESASTSSLQLETMPDFERAMARIEAWFAGAVLDRAPVRFLYTSPVFDEAIAAYPRLHPGAAPRDRWFDADYQVETFARSLVGRTFHGETFPIYYPNLGPEVYAALYGSELEYGDHTSWSKPVVREWADAERLRLDLNNAYGRKLYELTQVALERGKGRFLVGYTDLHVGVDCAAAWRDPQQLCFDMIEAPDETQALIARAIADFETVYDTFDGWLKAAGQPSSSWMCIPVWGRMHIPSCDFAALISTAMFEQYALPVLRREVRTMTHNIFHVDGPGMVKDLDLILSVPEVHAIQWVQGAGGPAPIAQWIPLVKRNQAQKPVIVALTPPELDDFMAAVRPEGIFLWVETTSEDEEIEALRRIARWH